MLDFSLVAPFLPYLLTGALVTIEISVLATALGLVLGLIAALARMSVFKPVKWVADFYVWSIRGTPVLVQLFIVYFGLPQIGIELGAMLAAVLALGANTGAYVAEILRGGILAVPAGQIEAAESLGMSSAKVMRRIILPQAFRLSIPALGNQAVSMLKESSLASLVTVNELMMVSQRFAATNYAYMEFYIVAAVIYLVMTTGMSWILGKIEFRMSVSER
ncbi:amino acid ABC transporter permease [Cryobacterium sp. TMT1-21]|uniref:Amino acid ABC transporter permease n=1 Tax=Cryobacterium shii TaxID=1259235 RepID=A0AAQ2C7B6_9MICO|nr:MULTISPECIES: amino acid ABC transporter permease [Cryobacterium]TFC48780.1 amino acid ABC transporter permease [Cryobacterium shii]TFC81758.1 amino acid ABC transporter permease [Cryobacterium sp. TmT2-59]TFD17577.1 amino acid ABC transporter permease [Cryobacterium sp. TMT4-10]TFD18259.1 amino acid ABC transporter permease [Cryobacterium sp. TMT1-21]TFD24847.1 amino acid ABC transporter permease [Cryobacterium sp. TMT2-23]